MSALACIPLTYEGSIIGVIYTDSKMSGKVLTELDLEILTSISLQIETTVQAILLQQSIELLQSQLINSSSFDGNDYNLFKLCH
ncbi:GAF domain-containing protein [Pseudoalteromonas espejiana]